MTGASHLIDNYLLFCNPTQLPGLLALWTVKIHENMQFLFAFINLNKKER